MMRLEIKKGWYQTVGHRFGWVKDGYSPQGVGIASHYFKGSTEIEIVVDKISGILETKDGVDFIKRYNSYETLSGGVIVGYVSRSLIKSVKGDPYSYKKEVKEVSPQSVLFKL